MLVTIIVVVVVVVLVVVVVVVVLGTQRASALQPSAGQSGESPSVYLSLSLLYLAQSESDEQSVSFHKHPVVVP